MHNNLMCPLSIQSRIFFINNAHFWKFYLPCLIITQDWVGFMSQPYLVEVVVEVEIEAEADLKLRLK